jgi:hypothetical protein
MSTFVYVPCTKKELEKISFNAGHSGPARVVALYLERHLLRTNQVFVTKFGRDQGRGTINILIKL